MQRTLLLALVVSLTGCAGPILDKEGSMQVKALMDMQVVSEDGEKGMVFMTGKSSSTRYCLAPTPDAVLTAGEGLNLTVPRKDGSISNSASMGSLDLGGRSPSVLITREIMYRTCEFSTNHQLPADEAMAFYERNLKALMTILGTQTEAGVGPLEAVASVNGDSDSSNSSGSSDDGGDDDSGDGDDDSGDS